MSDLGDQPQKPHHQESVLNRSPKPGGKPRPPLNRRQEGFSQLRTPDAQSSSNGSGSARSAARRTSPDNAAGLLGRLFGRRSRQRSKESAVATPGLDSSGQTARFRLDRDPVKRRDTTRGIGSTGLMYDRPVGWGRSRNNSASATGLGDFQGRGHSNSRGLNGGPTRLSSPADSSHPWRDRPRPFTVLQSNETKLQTELGSTPSLQSRREARRKQRMSADNRNLAADKVAVAGRSPSQLGRENLPPRRPRSPGVSAVLYATRMLILSVGVGVLAGTALSVWDPASRAPAGASQQSATKVAAVSSAPAPESVSQLQVGQEIAPLKATLQSLAGQSTNAQLTPGLFFLDMDSNAYVEVNGSMALPAASTIKVPVLVAFFQDVDAGKIRLDELLTMRQELIGSGSGEMQYLPVGSQFTALETVTKMITISDNTATNMLIARLGGIAALNQRFKSWGLTTTVINNVLPDLEGTNTTSPKDMALLMARISQGELVSLRSRDRMLDIMRKTVTDSLLPRGLGAGATISHKTGDIGGLVGDVGLIDMPNGKRYTAAVLVKRPFNDSRAQELIRQISRTTYEHFSRTQAGQSSRPPAAVSQSSSSAPSNP